MIKRSFIYATLAASLLCGTINSPVQAIRWDQLTDAEQRVCRKVHAGSGRLDAALEAVTAACKALGTAGRAWNTKIPETVAAVRGLREMIGEYFEPKQPLPHFTPQGLKLIVNLESTLGKIDALFTAGHVPVTGYPKLGIVAQTTADIQATYRDLVKGVPGFNGDRDPALLYRFLVEGYEGDLPRGRMPLRGDAPAARAAEFGVPAARAAEFGVPAARAAEFGALEARAARPAAAAARGQVREAFWWQNPQPQEEFDLAPLNPGMLAYDSEEEEDLRTPAARAAAATADVRQRPIHRPEEAAQNLAEAQGDLNEKLDQLLAENNPALVDAYLARIHLGRIPQRQNPVNIAPPRADQEGDPAEDAYMKMLIQNGDIPGQRAYREQLRQQAEDAARKARGEFVVEDRHLVAAGEVFKRVCPARADGNTQAKVSRLEFMLRMDSEACLRGLPQNQKKLILEELGLWDILTDL